MLALRVEGSSLLAGLLAAADVLPQALLVALFFGLWTAYAFVSGIVAVPYNDIVGRSVPSARRSRLLAIRFFGGGILALGVAAVAHHALNRFSFPSGYAVVVLLGAMLLCSGVFVMATKRNAIGVLIGVELVLNSAGVNFGAFDRYLVQPRPDGQIAAIFLIVLAPS